MSLKVEPVPELCMKMQRIFGVNENLSEPKKELRLSRVVPPNLSHSVPLIAKIKGIGWLFLYYRKLPRNLSVMQKTIVK